MAQRPLNDHTVKSLRVPHLHLANYQTPHIDAIILNCLHQNTNALAAAYRTASASVPKNRDSTSSSLSTNTLQISPSPDLLSTNDSPTVWLSITCARKKTNWPC